MMPRGYHWLMMEFEVAQNGKNCQVGRSLLIQALWSLGLLWQERLILHYSSNSARYLILGNAYIPRDQVNDCPHDLARRGLCPKKKSLFFFFFFFLLRLNILAISYILRSRDLQERYNPCRRGSYTPYPGSVRQSPQSVFFNGTAWRGNQNTITGSGRFYIFWKRTSSMEENKVHTYVGGNKVNLYAYWWVEQGYITRSRRRSLPSCGLTTWTPDGTLLLKWRRPKQERIFGSVMFNAQFALRYSARYAWLVGVVSRKGGNQYNGTFFADFYFISKFTFFFTT